MWGIFPLDRFASTFIMWRNFPLDNMSWGEFLHMTNFSPQTPSVVSVTNIRYGSYLIDQLTNSTQWRGIRSNIPWFYEFEALFCKMPLQWFCEINTLFCKTRKTQKTIGSWFRKHFWHRGCDMVRNLLAHLHTSNFCVCCAFALVLWNWYPFL